MWGRLSVGRDDGISRKWKAVWDVGGAHFVATFPMFPFAVHRQLALTTSRLLSATPQPLLLYTRFLTFTLRIKWTSLLPGALHQLAFYVATRPQRQFFARVPSARPPIWSMTRTKTFSVSICNLPLQGIIVPKFFGELRYDNTRALSLSDIGCVCLAVPEGAVLEVTDFWRLLFQAPTAFSHVRLLQEDEAERLDTWAVEYDDILRNNPATERKGREPRASPYKPQTWKGFKRSPIQPRSCCQELDANVRRPGDSDEDPPFPTPSPSRLGRKMVP